MFKRLKENFSQFAAILRNNGVSEKDISRIASQVEEKIKNEKPPQIAIIGFTGVGKSSTLNALFNSGRPTSDTRACTQEAESVVGNIEQYIGSKGIVEIYDMPGLGEDIDKDEEYYKIYADILPRVDAVIWTFHASDRVMAPMQHAITRLINLIGNEFVNHLVFAVNKADTAAPGESDWNKKFNIPSDKQKNNLLETQQYIYERVQKVIPNWRGPIVVYSAKYRYHLDQLMTAVIEAMPPMRRWVLDGVADVADYTELVDPEYIAYIRGLQ